MLKFIPGSHLLNIEKLKWLYKISCSKKGIKEPSFRLEKKYFKFFNKSKVALPLNKEKTVVLANTFMFHCKTNLILIMKECLIDLVVIMMVA